MTTTLLTRAARRILAVAAVASAGVLTTACTPAAPSTPNPQLPVPTAAQLSSARTALAGLPVVHRRPNIAGYDRSCRRGHACSFGAAWTDSSAAPGSGNGCDTRNDLLGQRLLYPTFKPGTHRCAVTAGTLLDPYTGRTIQWSKAHAHVVEIDHVVPLALAWDLGAARWSAARRVTYANDETHVLLVVDGPANESKGVRGPSSWMPANTAVRCAYDIKFVAILARYQLAITAPDKAAISHVFTRCT